MQFLGQVKLYRHHPPRGVSRLLHSPPAVQSVHLHLHRNRHQHQAELMKLLLMVMDKMKKDYESGGRSYGHKNYTTREIDQLAIVEEIEPMGSNMWKQVWDQYEQWANANGYPVRNQPGIKQKFGRLSGENKQTGDPHCPSPVRCAKHIARAILVRAQAATLEDD